jgi:hypothetical protein
LFASFASVDRDCVFRSSASMASIVTLMAVTALEVFRNWAFSKTELSVFDVLAFEAVIGVRTGA